jgi:transposase
MVAIGVDTHRDRHVAVALDRFGARLGWLVFDVDERGLRDLVRFARSFGRSAFVVEGTGSYGASLARALLAKQFAVYECERPDRRRRADKNDLIDAERAAWRLLSGERLALPRTGKPDRERLRLLLAERRSAQQSRTQAINQLKAALVTLDPPVRARLERLTPAQLVRRRQPELAPLRRLAQRIRQLELELAETNRDLDTLTRTLCPELIDQSGVGPVCAAQILVSTADPSRLRSEASFAALAGVSPIEASSGITKRHRLNRGGDRQLNWALHMTALNRIRYHEETRALRTPPRPGQDPTRSDPDHQTRPRPTDLPNTHRHTHLTSIEASPGAG